MLYSYDIDNSMFLAFSFFLGLEFNASLFWHTQLTCQNSENAFDTLHIKNLYSMYSSQIKISFQNTFVVLIMLSLKLIPTLYTVIVFIWFYVD